MQVILENTKLPDSSLQARGYLYVESHTGAEHDQKTHNVTSLTNQGTQWSCTVHKVIHWCWSTLMTSLEMVDSTSPHNRLISIWYWSSINQHFTVKFKSKTLQENIFALPVPGIWERQISILVFKKAYQALSTISSEKPQILCYITESTN